MLHAMHAESVYRSVTLNDGRLRSMLSVFVNHPTNAGFVYEASPGKIDGFMMGYVAPYFFSEELGAWDHFLYVRPQRRGSLIAYRLWKAFGDWAVQAGAKVMWLGTSANIDPALTRKFYTGLRMGEVGSLYRMTLDKTDRRAGRVRR